VSVLAFVPLGVEPALISEVEMWKFAGEELGKDAAIDAGLPKARAEYLVTGSAFVPGGEPQQGCMVRTKLGGSEKTIHVIGDRFWRGNVSGEPLPFAKMSLDWSNAFGGEGFNRNPMGKGFKPVTRNDTTLHPLPNIQIPYQPPLSPLDQPDPVGFGPIDISWPQRCTKAGTHDDIWLREDFPGFARDIDWTMFNTASPDQWFDKYLRGDEPYELENLHSDKPLIKGRLPGFTARCYVNRRTDENEIFGEIALSLSTVWFFPHRERAILVYHGQTSVAEDDASDILQMVIAAENLGQPKGDEFYRVLLSERIDKEKGPLLALRDKDLLPEGLAGAGDLPADDGIPTSDGFFRRNLQRNAEQRILAARAVVVGYGLDPDEHGPLVPPPEEPPPALDDIPEYIEAVKKQGKKLEADSKIRAEKSIKEAEKIFDKLGLDFDVVRKEMETPHTGPPILPGEKDRKTLQELSAQFKELGLPTDEMDAYIADPEREKLRAVGDESARNSYVKSAHHQEPAQKMPSEKSDLARSVLIQAHAAGKSLKGIDLTGANLSGLELRGIDIENAYLEHVDLDNTDLTGANLRNAVLAHSSLQGAILNDANAQGANFGSACFRNAKAHNVDLSRAILSKADLCDADLSGALLFDTEMMKVTFGNTILSRAKAEMLLFMEGDLNRIDFSGSQMKKCTFLKVNMKDVDFSGALLESSVFVTAKGEGILFRSADMTNVRFVEQCNFTSSDFSGACLRKANLRGTNLSGCSFNEAQLDDSDFSGCDLTKANFYHAVARNAQFVKACLVDAVMTAMNAMNGSFQKADIRGADLRGANLFQVDLARVRTDTRTNLTDALTKKVRVYPRRIYQ
jgi:uncharacterized protein YjbI with pentapeptide repeats